jgi:hypothetical protein
MTEPREKYNAGFVPPELPVGIERAMIRLLDFHVGREQAISRGDMLGALKSLGFRVSEREARSVINLLRKEGYLICSTGGEGGGYWLGANWQELNEYLERELHSRAMDLLEQEKALKNAAEQRWGRFSPEKQARMEI